MSLLSNAEAVKKLLADPRGMFHLIHQFNTYPAAYAHPTWFEELIPQALFQNLRKTHRGISRLSKILLLQKNLRNDVCYDFEYPWWRFALLPVDVLVKLTRYCGLVALHRQIAAVVNKSQLNHIKKSLGKQDYVFAVKRAPLLIGQQSDIDLFWNGHFSIRRLAQQFGIASFLSHFSDAPHAIRTRLGFKFSQSRQEITIGKTSKTNGWQLFKRILIHEIDSRWQPLFS